MNPKMPGEAKLPLNKNQIKLAQYIIKESKLAGFTADEAYTVTWIAFVESRLGENLKGKGTISGLYHYTDDSWDDRRIRYKYDKTDPAKHAQFKMFDWKSDKNDNNGQIVVFLEDFKRYKNEFQRMKAGERPEDVFAGNPQGAKAWERFTNPVNDIPNDLENFVYMRHNTSVSETRAVEKIRKRDTSGAYKLIRKHTDSIFRSDQQKSDSGRPYDGPAENINCLSTFQVVDVHDITNDDEDEYFGRSPGMC